MTPLLDALLVGLATYALTMAWSEGSLFDRARALTQEWRDCGDWWVSRQLGELLNCPFCLSYHVGFWLTFLTWRRHETTDLVLVWLGAVAVRALLSAMENYLLREATHAGTEAGNAGRDLSGDGGTAAPDAAEPT